jgi:hypothetical protein
MVRRKASSELYCCNQHVLMQCLIAGCLNSTYNAGQLQNFVFWRGFSPPLEPRLPGQCVIVIHPPLPVTHQIDVAISGLPSSQHVWLDNLHFRSQGGPKDAGMFSTRTVWMSNVTLQGRNHKASRALCTATNATLLAESALLAIMLAIGRVLAHCMLNACWSWSIAGTI